MRVFFLHEAGMGEYTQDDIPDLLVRDDGFLWVDVPSWDDDAEATLSLQMMLHPMLGEAFRRRNHVPTLHSYAEHFLVTMHAPLLARPGHVQLLELDLLVGRRHLLTVHGPISSVLRPAAAQVEVDAVLRRIHEGRFVPATPGQLAYAVTSAIARRQRALIGEIAEKLPGVERRVMGGDFRQPELLLEELFLIRHELLTGRTMAAQTHEVFARIASLKRHVADDNRKLARDLAEQFDRVRSIADGEVQFLVGVIDLYQTRVTTKMTVAMERLAVIAAVTLPVTALASVYGMNVIVNDSTRWVQVALILGVMLTISGTLLRWARRQGWW